MEFVPRVDAHLLALGFLFTCFLLGVAGVILVYGWARKKRNHVRRALLAAAAVAGAYLGALLALSLTSQEKVLAAGELKYFCELDCHLAYSVVNVATSKALGPAANPTTANGLFYVVTVKVWFDGRTISARRAKDLPLTPNPRAAAVVDGESRRFHPSPEGQRALEGIEGMQASLTQPLRPGESYTTQLVFDLPADSREPRLWVGDDFAFAHLLIGHESSLFHKKVFFRLEPPSEPAEISIASPAA